MKNQDIRNLHGALDYRIAYNSESDSPYKDIGYDVSAPLYWTDAQNVHAVNGLLQPMLGNTPMLAAKITGGILGMFQYEVQDAKYLIFNGGDGHQYLFNGAGIAPTSINSGLDITAKCNYTQYLQKMVTCNGKNDAWIYDHTTLTITPTGLFAVRGSYGKVCCSYASRLWIADGANLYYSDLGDPTQWVDDPATNKFGGYIDNFMGNTDNITGLHDFGVYMAVFTSNHIYLLTGNDPSDFAMEGFQEIGSSSSNGALLFNGTPYFFNDVNLNINVLDTGRGKQGSDTGQLAMGGSLTDRIHLGLTPILDIGTLNELFIVRYPAKNQIWFYIKQNNIADLSVAFVFDFQYQLKGNIPIYKRVMTPCVAVCEYNKQVYTGTSNGQIYLEDTGNTQGGDYGANNGLWYKFNVNFPKMEMGQAGIWKNIKSIKLMCNSARNNNFIVNLAYQGTSQHNIDVPVIINSNIFTLGTDTLGGYAILGQTTDLPVLIPSGAKFQSIAMSIRGTSVQNDMSLRMFSFCNIQDLQAI